MSLSRQLAPPAPLSLLIRIHLLQAFRRIKSLGEQSRLLTSIIVMFVLGYVTVSFWLFHKGLTFIGMFAGLGPVLIERMLFLLFAFLFVMLLFSNLVISYTNLFRNRETTFLLTLPISSQTLFQWKFLETSLLASWAFLFLIAPLLAAYGLTHHAPWHFYLMTLVLIALFIVLPTVAGSWLAVNLARFMDRRSFQIAAVTAAMLLLAMMAFWLKPEVVPEELEDTRVLGLLDRLLIRTRFAQHPLLPSYWLSSGVMQWIEGARGTAVFFLLVLLSYVVFFGLLSFTCMGRMFYDAASAVQSRGSVFGQWEWFRNWRDRQAAFSYPRGALDVLAGWCGRIPHDVRALAIKDLRMFWRDTTQWGQTLMLFGLLGVYIINLRHFSQQALNPFWTNLVSYLNLLACSLNLATLTTRFVYPQFSLEGKRLWIVGMAPLGLVRLLKTKFWLASSASLVLTLGLVWLSCQMLKLPLERTVFFSFAIVLMTLTLTGLAVGLGALYPNFKEDNPSKIVSGFGGTLCLVLSFLYIVSSVILLVFGSPWGVFSIPPPFTIALSWTAFVLLSVALGWVPYQLSLRRVVHLEI